MALSDPTPEEHEEALAAAAANRRALAELKERLKRGATTLKEVLDSAENVEFIGKLKVTHLLEAMPGVGVVRAKQIAQRLEIAPGVRVRELSQRQRKALLVEFSGE
jgi:hypothetical protein